MSAAAGDTAGAARRGGSAGLRAARRALIIDTNALTRAATGLSRKHEGTARRLVVQSNRGDARTPIAGKEFAIALTSQRIE
jgi:hypothetical protein